MIVNNTPYAVDEAVLTDAQGREVYVAVVKASFHWRADGTLEPLAEAAPIVVGDLYGGPPESSGLVFANEVTLAKPKVDVLVAGEIVPRAASEALECSLEVGTQIRKTLRVFGDRYWSPGVLHPIVPSRAKPFSRMPIAWARSFGGTDPDDPSVVDRRNPVGRGVRKRASALKGLPAPNFEDPRAPISNPTKRPIPVGFGPIAPHWQPRSDLAGTYDEAWKNDRYPLLPLDFDPRFLNVAPADQQLDRYEPGSEVRLTDFTPARRERFRLPEFAPLLTVVDAPTIVEVACAVDTIVLEPALARVSIVARASYVPRDVAALTTAFAGPLSRGQRRALKAGKPYLRLRA